MNKNVLTILKERDAFTIPEIQSETGLSYLKIREAAEKLTKSGDFVFDGEMKYERKKVSVNVCAENKPKNTESGTENEGGGRTVNDYINRMRRQMARMNADRRAFDDDFADGARKTLADKLNEGAPSYENTPYDEFIAELAPALRRFTTYKAGGMKVAIDGILPDGEQLILSVEKRQGGYYFTDNSCTFGVANRTGKILSFRFFYSKLNSEWGGRNGKVFAVNGNELCVMIKNVNFGALYMWRLIGEIASFFDNKL